MILETILRRLVDPVIQTPGTGFIECHDRGGCVFLTFTPEPCDYGRIIGRQGQNFQTLKTLLEPVAWRDGKMVRFSILESRCHGERANPIPANPKWRPDGIVAIIGDYMEAVGQPREADAFQDAAGWRIMAAGRLKQSVADALRRWVSIMAASQGGRALFNDERLAV